MPKNKLKKFLFSSAIGAGIGILLTSTFILFMAMALTIGDVPAMLISPVTVVLLAAGGFLGGFSSAKISKEKGLICGAVSGIIFFIILWILGSFFENSGFGIAAVIKMTMIIISASLGGIIGVNYIKRK